LGNCDGKSLQNPIWRHVGIVTPSLQFGCGRAFIQDFWHWQLARHKRQTVNVTPACFNMLC